MNETSKEQIEANRENGKKGGVKTEEGKAISKYNALKHGLFSKEILLLEEDEETLLELGKKMRGDLEPASELELMLVDRIVANIWRLRRAMQVEKEMIEDDCNGLDWQGKPKDKTLGEAFTHDFVNSETYLKFAKYEAGIERGIYRALHELERLQSKRNGGNPAPPIAVDIDI